MPRKTVSRYLDLLEQIFLIWRIPAYAKERGRRVTRALLGGMLETFVVNELRAQASWSVTQPKLFHYREYEGLEIDAVLERRNGDVSAIEIKATSSPGENDLRAMRKFKEVAGAQFRRGVLLYGGSKQLTFGEDLVALPISALWSQAARAQ